MSKIDPTARIEDGAVIGADVSIGPYCTVGPNVAIGAGTVLLGHVNVTGHTTIGESCTIHPFASLGGAPQSTGYKGEPTTLQIGNACTIRENVTMNTGTVGGGGVTRVGDRGFFMAASHVGHDCIVGNDVIFANAATLGGHCEIGDFTFIGGMTVLQQFTRVGPQVMIGGMSGLREHVIPYALANGIYAKLSGLNIVGMRRRKFTKDRIALVRAFFNDLFYGRGVFAERLDQVRPRASDDPAIAEILAFIDGGKGRRGALCMARQGAAPVNDSDDG